MPSLGGYSYEVEYNGSGGFTLNDSADAAMIYKCAHADAFNLGKLIRGKTTYVDGAVLIETPQQHPNFPELYCYEVTCEPLTPKRSGATDFNGWDQSLLYARYKPLPYNPLIIGSALLEEEALEFSGQVETIPKAYFGFSAAAPTEIPVQKVVPLICYTIRKMRQPRLPLTAILAACGKLNSATFRGAEPETMLYAGANASRSITSAGASEWTVEHKFLYNPNNHNKEWWGPVFGYAYVYSPPGGSKKKYDTVAFTTLGLSAIGQGV